MRVLDPINIVGGTDTWNPLAEIDPKDILHLQRIAPSLLPEQAQGEAVYFQSRAVDVIVGAFLAAHAIVRPMPKCTAWLLSNLPQFEKALAPLKGAAAAAAKGVLAMGQKGRDSILSTAAQAFSWCADEGLQRMTMKAVSLSRT